MFTILDLNIYGGQNSTIPACPQEAKLAQIAQAVGDKDELICFDTNDQRN
jgi:hypothetical protein